MTRTFNVRDFGAKGDGVADDTTAIQRSLNAVAASSIGGCVYIPAGTFRITNALILRGTKVSVSIRGDGDGATVILADGGINALDLSFLQDGVTQPFGLSLENMCFRAISRAGTAITVSYGDPPVTSDHFQPSVTLRGVTVASSPTGSWSHGIDIDAAWNISMTDVFLSGDPMGGQWGKLSGAGIRLRRMCVNSHFVNCRCNFWADGFLYDNSSGPNTEGLFFANCSCVAVKRGVRIVGNPDAVAPRVSTFTWTGGAIELRVTGVTELSAAFSLVNVWTALISSCQAITDALPEGKLTYAVLLENCHGVVVTGCDLNAFVYGVHSAGACKAISSHGNTFTNCAKQTVFPDGTMDSRSYGHVLVNNAPFNWSATGANKMGFVD